MKNCEKVNQLKHIRSLLDGMQGHNYSFPDCIKFIFEHLGEYENLDFWSIAAITGDAITQVYNRNTSTRCEYCVSGYLAGEKYITEVFSALGYDCEYASAEQISADKNGYMQKITEYIDRDIPVLVKSNINDIPAWKSDVGTYCLIVGYENNGQTLKLLIYDTVTIDYEITDDNKSDLIFIGKKQHDISLENIYLNIINKMYYWLTLPEKNGMFFGAAAYRAWADDIETGRFENESLSLWDNYGVYVCNLATNGGGPVYIFKNLASMNSSYSRLGDLGDKIQEFMPTENGRNLLWVRLDKLGAGMNMDDVKITMSDKEKRSLAADALRNYAKQIDRISVLLKKSDLQLYCSRKRN